LGSASKRNESEHGAGQRISYALLDLLRIIRNRVHGSLRLDIPRTVSKTNKKKTTKFVEDTSLRIANTRFLADDFLTHLEIFSRKIGFNDPNGGFCMHG